jgi:hypothetical protein
LPLEENVSRTKGNKYPRREAARGSCPRTPQHAPRSGMQTRVVFKPYQFERQEPMNNFHTIINSYPPPNRGKGRNPLKFGTTMNKYKIRTSGYSPSQYCFPVGKIHNASTICDFQITTSAKYHGPINPGQNLAVKATASDNMVETIIRNAPILASLSAGCLLDYEQALTLRTVLMRKQRGIRDCEIRHEIEGIRSLP